MNVCKAERKISSKGLDLLKVLEGLSLTAYQCIAGVWTIGYGHTKTAKPGMVITEEVADELLREDVRDSEFDVNRLVEVHLTQSQFDALVCFTYNLGAHNLKSSTLLKKLNAGDYYGAANQFPLWVRSRGRVIKGLVRRRESERQLFLSET